MAVDLMQHVNSFPLWFRVYVADSLVLGAGDGLFAKVDAEPNTVMAFYNGVRITHSEVEVFVCLFMF